MKIIEITSHDDYRNERVVEVSGLTLAGIDELLADSPYNRTVSTNQRVKLLQQLNKRSAGDIGWADYWVAPLSRSHAR